MLLRGLELSVRATEYSNGHRQFVHVFWGEAPVVVTLVVGRDPPPGCRP